MSTIPTEQVMVFGPFCRLGDLTANHFLPQARISGASCASPPPKTLVFLLSVTVTRPAPLFRKLERGVGQSFGGKA